MYYIYILYYINILCICVYCIYTYILYGFIIILFPSDPVHPNSSWKHIRPTWVLYLFELVSFQRDFHSMATPVYRVVHQPRKFWSQKK